MNTLSKKFKFSEALAGVTLLALANGAPDIISSFVAGGEDNGVIISIGALYGASLFVCNFVFCIVIRASPHKSIKIPSKYFLRDVTLFFIATTLIFIFSFFDVPLWCVSTLFFITYALYVSYVVWMEIIERKKKQNSLKVKLYLILATT